MDYQNTLFVGVDTHKNQHTAVVVNCFHQKIGEVEIANNPTCFTKLIDKINSFDSDQKDIIFGL
ncbi:IS110 family transposase, partial [Natroniella acetigena]|nr:IS110 family transposase [Natroniella acetigena]